MASQSEYTNHCVTPYLFGIALQVVFRKLVFEFVDNMFYVRMQLWQDIRTDIKQGKKRLTVFS